MNCFQEKYIPHIPLTAEIFIVLGIELCSVLKYWFDSKHQTTGFKFAKYLLNFSFFTYFLWNIQNKRNLGKYCTIYIRLLIQGTGGVKWYFSHANENSHKCSAFKAEKTFSQLVVKVFRFVRNHLFNSVHNSNL